MVNRTSRPIALNQSNDLTAMGIHTRSRVPAFLGDGSGNVEAIANGADTSHYGKVWIRFASGLDSDGNTNFSQAVTARIETSFPHKTNLPVLVQKDGTTDEWVVVQIDYKRTVAAGLNTNAYNPLSPASQRVHLRQVVEGNLFAVSTSANPSNKVVVEPLVIYYNGSLFNAGKTVADNIDLSSYIPTDGTEKLIAVGERLYDRSIQIVDGTTRQISSLKYSLSDVNVLASGFDDMIMPLRAVRLGNNSGTITQSDMHIDLRQFVNVERPRGFPNPVTRHTYIESGFQETVNGKLYITTGKVHIAGKLVIRTESAPYTYGAKTANYSVTIDDETIGADSSGGSFTVTLPTAVGIAGKAFRVKKLSAGGIVTVATTSSQTIDGSSTATLTAQYIAIVLISTGSNWIIG